MSTLFFSLIFMNISHICIHFGISRRQVCFMNLFISFIFLFISVHEKRPYDISHGLFIAFRLSG